jgi:hypothetical protein
MAWFADNIAVHHTLARPRESDQQRALNILSLWDCPIANASSGLVALVYPACARFVCRAGRMFRASEDAIPFMSR